MARFENTGAILARDEALKDGWKPDKLPEREDELDIMEEAFEPAAKGRSSPSNMFVYGPSGQGKTVATKLMINEVREFRNNSTDDMEPYNVFYVNCADLSSSYQVVGEIVKEVSDEYDQRPRGLAESTLTDMMFDAMEEIGGIITVVLDEIDVIGSDDTILYNLSRAKENDEVEECDVSIVGISNNFDFRSQLTSRVKDSLCEEEIRFSPYNANQIRNILHRRADIGLEDDSLNEGVVQKCAAYAAQKNGSARQAINLMYKAAKMAHNSGSDKIEIDDVDVAEEKINRDMLLEGLKDLTVQEYATMLSVASLEAKEETPARTKEVYSEYKRICKNADVNVSTMRSVRDHLQSLNLYQFLDGEKRTGGVDGGERWLFELSVDLENMLSVPADERFIDVEETIEMCAMKNDLI